MRRKLNQSYLPGRQRAIVLTHYDPNWRTGRIGQWVRAYRPDLMST